MKYLSKLLLGVLTLGLLIASCSIEKRVHLPGYHVEWKNNKYNSKVIESHHGINSDEFTEKVNLEDDKSPLSNTQTEKATIEMTTDFVAEEQNSELLFNDSPVHSKKTFSKRNSHLQKINLVNSSELVSVNTKIRLTNFRTKKIAQDDKEDGDGKSQVVALILVLLVGVIGVHRFYLGYTGIGVLMILTVGCCGILTLIDLIRICTGSLKPKDGDYTDTL